MKGLHNKLLNVNLSNSEIAEHPIDDQLIENYIGGRGLGVKLFTDRVKPKLDPLSKENILVFAVGPLTSTMVPTSGRSALVTKSPLTGGILYSNTGGFFGNYFKNNGYDCIIIEGKAEKPQYLVIDHENGNSLKSAEDLWGLDTRETMQKFRELEGEKIHALMIGPAGEHQVLISSIMNDGDHRAFGRGGCGAVMGSKNLKGIVVKRGKKRTEIEDRKRLKTYVKSAMDKINLVPITRASLPMFGTSALINIINELDMLPTKNFQKGFSEEADQVSGESIREKIFQKKEGCFACPIQCGRLTKAGDMEGKGPEYETVTMLGPDVGVFDLKEVTQANYLCNLLGLDTISAGGTIACAMEMNEKGIIEEDGLDFGNAAVLKPMIKKMAYKEGIGKDLSEGSLRFAKKYGHPELSMAVKGLELPAYDPRGAKGHALGYATSNRGGCHLTGYLAAMEIFSAPKKIPRHTVGGKADLLALKQHQSAVEDSLVVCAFAGWALGFDFYSRFTEAITGKDFNVTKLMEIGERIYNLERMYNIREGLTRADDTLPPRFLKEELKEGPSVNSVVPIKKMINDYYNVRKWNEKGLPTKGKLKELGLSMLAGTEEI